MIAVSRRRVIFNFSEVVPENERDPLLRDKVAAELAEYSQHYLRKKRKQGIRSNLSLNIDTVIEWLPKLTKDSLPEE
ncbi:hypothetical protein SAMN05421784_1445 [Xenorhabdus koppenhoeferi]|uniref:Uncharacterized protein n=1 Tax=Xenorhabdus koppenhoeferi TaxID=351659 RepID=A0A1I7K1G1_9GAMM|nr:hypothetical protein SAMN05421784_1445 [Xenorhabdus koppenhoeferi]